MNTKLVMAALSVAFCLFGGTAEAKSVTVKTVLDDSGRFFDKGDYINIAVNGHDLKKVALRLKGESGARMTLFVDGVSKGTIDIGSRETETYSWDLDERDVRRAEVRFSQDPIVYWTEVTLDVPAEIIKEVVTVVEIKVVEVPKMFVNTVARSLVEGLKGLYQGTTKAEPFGKFIEEGLYHAENLELYSGKSPDSDASYLTGIEVIRILQTLECSKSRLIWRAYQNKTGDRQVIRNLRADLVSLREISDYFAEDDCTEFTESWYEENKGSLE